MKFVPDHVQLRGVEKAAVLFLCIGEERGSALMRQLDEVEIQRITQAMSTLGTIPASVVEEVMREFSMGIGGGSGVVGSFDIAERMLAGFLPKDKVTEIMQDIRGPISGRNVWETFATLNEQMIHAYLSGETNQTAAAILSRVKPDVAARVLPLFPREQMTDIIQRMISLAPMPRYVIDLLEETLENDFLRAATRRSGPDPHQRIADMFNKLDGSIFDEISEELAASDPQAFASIKQKMFTFDDLARLDQNSLSRLIRSAEGATVPLALRGAKKAIRDRFIEALTVRAREMLLEEMAALGPVRARDAREAQDKLIDIANDLARQNIIRLPSADDQILADL